MGLILEGKSPEKRPAGPYRRGLLVLLTVLVAFLVLDLISHKPGLSGLFLLGLMGVVVAGSIGRDYRERMTALRRRTCIAIADILSDGQGRGRDVIVPEVRRRIHALRHPAFRWLGLESRALDEMTRRKMLKFREGKYSEPQ